MSDTPRTDLAEIEGYPFSYVDADFSRYLERELAELRVDAGRLNWLEKLEDNFCNIDRITSAHGKFNGKKQSLRDAIDAAMKEGGK